MTIDVGTDTQLTRCAEMQHKDRTSEMLRGIRLTEYLFMMQTTLPDCPGQVQVT